MNVNNVTSEKLFTIYTRCYEKKVPWRKKCKDLCPKEFYSLPCQKETFFFHIFLFCI